MVSILIQIMSPAASPAARAFMSRLSRRSFGHRLDFARFLDLRFVFLLIMLDLSMSLP